MSHWALIGNLFSSEGPDEFGKVSVEFKPVLWIRDSLVRIRIRTTDKRIRIRIRILLFSAVTFKKK